jgi:hypothetical protein
MPGHLAALPDFLPEDRFLALREEILGIAKNRAQLSCAAQEGQRHRLRSWTPIAPRKGYNCTPIYKMGSAVNRG